ncbi:DNA cytosine methyltransferase [Lutibacter sp.]
MKTNNFTFIDLFSGIGGFKMALERNSGQSLGFSEINSDAISTYCENFNEDTQKNYGDIKKIKKLPPHNLLTAGVPCQSWSIAGRNLGFDDDRGQLWNDTIFLLQQSQPDTFIFENVKGLVDPRNREALSYILSRIKKAGYYANYYVINSHDYGVPQNRIRVYIVGFRNKKYFERFKIPEFHEKKIKLADILKVKVVSDTKEYIQRDLFGNEIPKKSMSLSSKNGFNDYFLFNDLRNGHTTIHSWDILDTTDRQKDICLILLKNRRKKIFGNLDGNPLSLDNFQSIDSSISQEDINELINLGIFKEEKYLFIINSLNNHDLSEDEKAILAVSKGKYINIDDLKSNKKLKIKRVSIINSLDLLERKKIITCCEIRYDFKNTKISTGLFGVNRIFLPTSDVFPTLVASDTNDYITLENIAKETPEKYKEEFIKKVYERKRFRKITKKEACLIQGFPENFKLPESRTRWMKLIGNSVSVPVIDILCKAINNTGVFNKTT